MSHSTPFGHQPTNGKHDSVPSLMRWTSATDTPEKNRSCWGRLKTRKTISSEAIGLE